MVTEKLNVYISEKANRIFYYIPTGLWLSIMITYTLFVTKQFILAYDPGFT